MQPAPHAASEPPKVPHSRGRAGELEACHVNAETSGGRGHGPAGAPVARANAAGRRQRRPQVVVLPRTAYLALAADRAKKFCVPFWIRR